MNEEPAPASGSTPEAPSVSKYGAKGLESYLAGHRSAFTEDALRSAALAVGWEVSVVDKALSKTRDAERTAPTRARARRISRYLYLGGFVVLSIGMIGYQSVGVLATTILAASLGAAYALGSLWVRAKKIGTYAPGDVAYVLLVVPVVLWLAVSGLCLATGLPFRNGRF